MSIPCPIGTTFGDGSGKERVSTVTIADETRSARRSVGPPRQCVNQSTSGIPSGRTIGAASTA